MAFVLVPHLSPERKSIMAELLKRHTAMDVAQAEEGMEVKPELRVHHPARTGTWPSRTTRSGSRSPPNPAASAIPSISFSGPLHGTGASGPYASSSPARARKGPSACGPSRARAGLSWPRTSRRPNSTACRQAPSPRDLSITSSRRRRCPSSCCATQKAPMRAPSRRRRNPRRRPARHCRRSSD